MTRTLKDCKYLEDVYIRVKVVRVPGSSFSGQPDKVGIAIFDSKDTAKQISTELPLPDSFPVIIDPNQPIQVGDRVEVISPGSNLGNKAKVLFVDNEEEQILMRWEHKIYSSRGQNALYSMKSVKRI